MGERLKGKVALVTGAGRGIGRSHALALAAEGAKVVVNDLGGAADGSGEGKAPADEVVQEIKKMGGEAATNYDSVSTTEGGEAMIKTAVDTFGKLDILVNNAGILRDRMSFNMTPEEWDLVIKVHLYGHFNTIRPACTLFRQQKGGRIINTSSTSGLGNMGQANYSAAKEGIVGLTKTIALEMGRYGVTCNAIRPVAATRMTLSDEMKHAMERKGQAGAITMLEQNQPEDISPLIVYLATDEAANVNGCVFFVRHGQIGIYPNQELVRSMFKEGRWTIDEICKTFPVSLGAGLVNPSPPKTE
ncbi:MAG: SDR family oxidoreductase [Thermodesulfobacteriota bacterium]|nr:SDR family oxidoreductase [Thermodesulfobacteriota bacterium]